MQHEQLKKQFKKTVRDIVNSKRQILSNSKLISAAVLLGFVMRDKDPFLVLTKRTMTVANHKGQISLPGGVVELTDTSIVETALREANEEIALDKSLVEIAGLLDDTITTTGFLVTPVVGFISPNVTFKAAPAEVSKIFEVSFSKLCDPKNYMTKVKFDNGKQYTDHRYLIDNHVIWGATGRIIKNFIQSYNNK